MNDAKAPDQGSIAKGLGLLLALHAGAALACCALAVAGGSRPGDGLTLMFFVGGIQIVYVAPAAIVCSSRRKQRTLKGLLLGAGITFLVNAACAGIVLASI
jgi:hypothetical protein